MDVYWNARCDSSTQNMCGEKRTHTRVNSSSAFQAVSTFSWRSDPLFEMHMRAVSGVLLQMCFRQENYLG